MFSIIAAIGKNRELGKQGKLIWRLPGDMKYFKDTTMGHTVLMGRKTFESIPGGKGLSGRRNIVLSTTKTGDDTISPKRSVASLATSGTRPSSRGSSPVLVVTADVGEIDHAPVFVSDLKAFAEANVDSPEEIFVIGGGMVYWEMLKFAKRLYLTEVDAEEKQADTFFPEFDKNEFSRVEIGKGEDHGIKYTFVRYDRKN